MDRLVCGDVGFGKTEVAIRAAFKAVQDGKQVAVLVPTTLLAQQHFQTFSDRFAGYPVRVEVLSPVPHRRPRPRRSSTGVRDGEVDVVIGTHRLLSDDIEFKDLGLLVVDEEQRFGVSHKEQIKQLQDRRRRAHAHGHADPAHARDEPHRHPRPHAAQHAAGRAPADPHLRRRVRRPGRRPRPSAASCCARARCSSCTTGCRTSSDVAAELRDLVPEARIAIAHGQMDEGTLEQVVLDFWEGEYDVLVCTTIIESGIDMPTVNTLVVDRADLLGLGQLHQLRGRVGRAGQRAYAYLFYPPDRALTEEAYERLKTIGEATELGSGFKIAMRDLEIRGAGNLLGTGQSRPHRRRRLRPLLPDGHRGGGRAEGRAGRASRPRSSSTCRSTPTCPPDYVGQGGAAARGLPAARRGHHRRRGRRHPRRVGGPLRPGARRRPRRCSRSPACGPSASAPASARSPSPRAPAFGGPAYMARDRAGRAADQQGRSASSGSTRTPSTRRTSASSSCRSKAAADSAGT